VSDARERAYKTGEKSIKFKLNRGSVRKKIKIHREEHKRKAASKRYLQ